MSNAEVTTSDLAGVSDTRDAPDEADLSQPVADDRQPLLPREQT